MRIACWVLLVFSTVVFARNVADDRFKTLSAADQRTALASVVRSAGDRCGAVTKMLSRGRDRQDHAYYAVMCKEGADYQVRIEANATGSTSVLSCAVMKALNTACWSKF